MIIVINVTYNDNCDGNSNNDSDNDILQASAFSVPPQQFISSDGGIVEMGAEVDAVVIHLEYIMTYKEVLKPCQN